MKDIKKPNFMAEIKSGGHSPVLEILIALAVYFVGSMIGSFVQLPALMAYMFGNREYQEMLFSGRVDMDKIIELVANVPQWINIVILVGELGLILTVFLYCRLLEKRKLSTLGFQRRGCVISYVKGMFLGLFLFGAAYLLCYMSGSIAVGGVSFSVGTVLYVVGFFFGYLIQGMAEEVLCRGYLLVSLCRRCSVTLSVVLSSLFFSMLHGMNQGVTLLAHINLFLFGIFLALLFLRSGNIWIVGAVHSIWNFVQGNIFGVQVSGMRVQPSIIRSSMKEGWDIINGGAFGLEGGLAVTLVLLLAVTAVIQSMKKHGMFVEVHSKNENTVSGELPFRSVMNENRNVSSDEGDAGGNVARPEEPYQNMGLNPEETPWYPEEKHEEKKEKDTNVTGFDQSYFRE